MNQKRREHIQQISQGYRQLIKATPTHTSYQFLITGKIKPYVRMTRRGKWRDENAQEYLASQMAIGRQIQNQMALNGWVMLPIKTPLKLEVTAILPERLYTFDIDNLGKAIQDALQGIVLQNDCWIIETRFTKTLGDDYSTLIFVGTV